jgi:hypothetical protein
MGAEVPAYAWCDAGQDDPVPLPYLVDPDYGSYDIKLEVGIKGESMDANAPVARSNFANMYHFRNTSMWLLIKTLDWLRLTCVSMLNRRTYVTGRYVHHML